jgi:hypothetical protein
MIVPIAARAAQRQITIISGEKTIIQIKERICRWPGGKTGPLRVLVNQRYDAIAVRNYPMGQLQ